MKKIIITNIDWIEAQNPYTQIAHQRLPVFSAAEPENPSSFVSMPEIETETVHARHFYLDRARGHNPDGSTKYERELDICVGMATDVQKALGVYIEGASDAFNAAESKSNEIDNVRRELRFAQESIEEFRVRDRELCQIIEERDVSIEKYTSMTFWKRIKWAFNPSKHP